MFDHRTSLNRGSALTQAESVLSCGTNGRRKPKAAFTLPELLVVIAIIGILTSLLSTAFNNTKARGQKISCLNNMRQLSLAWLSYVDENENMLPLNKTGPSPLPEQFFGRRLATNSWTGGSPKEDVTPEKIIRGTLFPYTGKSVAVYHCPSDRSTVVNRKDVLRNRSFSMNGYLNGDNSDRQDDPRIKIKDSELINPSPERIFVFAEEHEESPWLGGFWVLPRESVTVASAVSWTSVPSDRHNQGCNLTFADGHVEYWKWFWPKRVVSQTKLTANGHELRDLTRLQSSIPMP